MSTQTRTREDWIAAGLAELAKPGTARLSVAPIAAALSATKGSFYWHFKGLDDFRLSVAETYEARCEARLASPPDVDDGLAALLGGLAPDPAAESALRVLARDDPAVSAVIERIDRRRIEAIGALLLDQGAETARAPRMIYALWLGCEALAVPLGIPADKMRRAAMVRFVA